MRLLSVGIIFCALMGSTSVMASHFFACKLSAEVIEVTALARLNGTAVLGRHDGTDFKPDQEEVVTLKVLETLESSGRNDCGNNWEAKLYVQPTDNGTFKVGDKLTLDYRNVGDARASRISWNVVE